MRGECSYTPPLTCTHETGTFKAGRDVAVSIYQVKISDTARKELKKIPKHVAMKLFHWIDDVAFYGLEEVRKTPSYHDERLKGKWQGYRSIRLNKAYRAFYII